MQVSRRTDAGTFERIYAVDGPAYSPALRAWAVPIDGGRMLRIANDAAGADMWRTGEECARAEGERARAENERARAAEEAARTRIAALEAELARRGR